MGLFMRYLVILFLRTTYKCIDDIRSFTSKTHHHFAQTGDQDRHRKTKEQK